MTYTIPKGVFDILPYEEKEENQWREAHRYEYLIKVLKDLAKTYGFEEISTPIFENTELFLRSIGTDTDIVAKEMYTFDDKGERSMTLRPEGTAPVMRAFIEKQMAQFSYCNKLFYTGPMFRYERQQAGRYRQFYQFGAEIVGLPSAQLDVEIIDFLYTLFQRLGLSELTIHINSIGNRECRANYREALLEYLHPFKDKLSEDSQRRLEKNPLRILDSKDPVDQTIVANAPLLKDYLEEDSREHFQEVQKWLKILKIPFIVSEKLVRGLDYYNRTVFEVVSGNLGAQNTIAAGGRYDYLLKDLGGPDLPAVGFAVGLERILQTMMAQKCSFPHKSVPLLLIIPLGEPAHQVCFQLLKELSLHHIPAEVDYSNKKLKNVLRYGDKKGIPYVLIIGEEELEKQKLTLKHMASSKEEEVALDQLILTMKNKLHDV